MKKIFLSTICSLFITIHIYAQVPADSLVGTYLGECHYKAAPNDPWTIYPNVNLIVAGTPLGQHVDSVNCKVSLNGSVWHYAITPLYTNYTYCNSTIIGNYYSWFHDMDSITAIADSNTIPYPSPPPFAARFYGKRINNNIGMGIHESISDDKLKIYPNPSSNVLFVENNILGDIEIKIIDFSGKAIMNVKMNNRKMQIDISGLSVGIYFAKVQTKESVFTKKIVVTR